MVMPAGLTVTTTELLDGLHQPDNRAAWEEFDRRYRSILMAFLRRTGLNDADAADVTQDSLTSFVQAYREHKYDRQQGRLRSWLIGIARCRLADLGRKQGRRRELRGESAILSLPDDADAESVWEAEERRCIFERAIGELRQTARFNERTIEAFDRVVLRREPVEAVSAQLGLSPQEIYSAKSRVVERLREIVKRYELCFQGG